MKKAENLQKTAALNLRAIRVLHRVSPRFFPVLTLYCVFNAITPYVTVFFSARILRELAVLRREELLWRWVLAGVLCTAAAAMGKALLDRRYNTLLSDMIGRKEILFIRKAFDMDYGALDNQENRDLRDQIKETENWAGFGLERVPDIYAEVLTGVIGLLSGMALTVRLFTAPVPESGGWLTVLNHPVFIVVLAAGILAVSILAGHLGSKVKLCWVEHSEEATFGNRLFSHFGFLGGEKKRSMDIRMNDQQRLIGAYWKENSAFGTLGIMGKAARKMGAYAALGASVTALTTGIIYLFTCLKALGGAFDVGSCTQYIGAATAMVANVFALSDIAGLLKANTPYLEKTFAYLDIPNEMYQGSLTTEKRSDRQYTVEFRDVSFRYPESEQYALRHVNMKFRVGERLAVVGMNGSGKTTFIKLLCRLYDPTEGVILLNGIDIRKYRYDEYMDIFSVVFQDFQLFSLPLGQNVAARQNYDAARVTDCLEKAGFGERLAKMPQGLNTYLYKELDENGVEVSGGEAQKIAIARALYKDAPFIILDEPTAALDPIAEAEIYAKFNEIAGDKTAIYISHRLSSCKFCDEIAVFDHGAVIQQGTHEALLADENGKYHELWHAQAQYYTPAESA